MGSGGRDPSTQRFSGFFNKNKAFFRHKFLLYNNTLDESKQKMKLSYFAWIMTNFTIHFKQWCSYGTLCPDFEVKNRCKSAEEAKVEHLL